MKTIDMLNNMSTIDKATLLNLLRLERFSATPLQGMTIDIMIRQYDKTINIIVDSYLFKMYGLFYKDYIDSMDGWRTICINPIKIDKAIDKGIIHNLQELNRYEG